MKEIGIKHFNIIQKMIIDPRNELEHLYKKPFKDIAHESVQLAEMYLDSTQKEFDHGSIIVINSSFLYGIAADSNEMNLFFHGYSNHPMFVIDILNKEMKILFPKERELNYTKIYSFNLAQLYEISKELRSAEYRSITKISLGLVQELFKQSSI